MADPGEPTDGVWSHPHLWSARGGVAAPDRSRLGAGPAAHHLSEAAGHQDHQRCPPQLTKAGASGTWVGSLELNNKLNPAEVIELS